MPEMMDLTMSRTQLKRCGAATTMMRVSQVMGMHVSPIKTTTLKIMTTS